MEAPPGERRTGRPLGREGGFTTIELMLAVLLAGTAMIALITTLDHSRELVSLSEREEAAVHVGEKEIERIHSLGYEAVGLKSVPAPSTSSLDPAFYVVAGPPALYRWNQTAGAPLPHTEPLAVDPVRGEVDPAPSEWSDGRLRGSVHRFVTWVDDGACGSLCPGGGDYKRVTVAVTAEGGRRPLKPILLSSIISDPDAKPEGFVADGVQNPLLDPSTTCLDPSGSRVECSRSIGAARTWFLYDTPATSTAREEVRGDHPTHPTVAPSGECTQRSSSGCPVPDLLGPEPPPASQVPPPLFDYSSEVADASYAGGRVLRRDVDCTAEPTASENAKGQLWTTSPLGAATTLTGAGGLTLYSERLGGGGSAVTLCVRFLDVSPESFANLIARPPLHLGTVSYRLGAWPAAPGPVSFGLDFRGGKGNATVPAGHRIGVRVWAAASSESDITAVYDHPSYASFVQLNAVES